MTDANTAQSDRKPYQPQVGDLLTVRDGGVVERPGSNYREAVRLREGDAVLVLGVYTHALDVMTPWGPMTLNRTRFCK